MGSEVFEDSELGEVLDFDGFAGSKQNKPKVMSH